MGKKKTAAALCALCLLLTRASLARAAGEA